MYSINFTILNLNGCWINYHSQNIRPIFILFNISFSFDRFVKMYSTLGWEIVRKIINIPISSFPIRMRNWVEVRATQLVSINSLYQLCLFALCRYLFSSWAIVRAFCFLRVYTSVFFQRTQYVYSFCKSSL